MKKSIMREQRLSCLNYAGREIFRYLTSSMRHPKFISE
jgi:hypothetical protein